MRYLLALLCAAFLCSCSFVEGIFGSSDEVRYFTDRAQYTTDQSLTITLANEMDKAVGHNLCSSVLERRQSGKWQVALEQEGRACTDAIYPLAASQAVTFTFALGAQLPAGTYRCKTRLYQLDQYGAVQSSREIVTDRFEVNR